MAPKNLLITGSTAHQGLAIINALLSPSPSSTPTHTPPTTSSLGEFHIFALTRNPTSPSAQRLLASHKNITLVKGDSLNPSEIFSKLPQIYGIFLVTHPDTTEKQQGEGMVDIALEKGVQHFIFSSADRGADQEGGTGIEHFERKRELELYLRHACSTSPVKRRGEDGTEEGGMKFTILQPTSFMDNLTPNMQGKILTTLLSQLPIEKKLAFISVRDIGRVAAMAFRDPEKYAGRMMPLAGDYLTFSEMEQIFECETGRKMERSYGVLGSVLKWAIGELGDTMRWMGERGYGDVDEGLKEELGLVGFAGWVRNYSGFVVRDGEDE